MMHMIGAQSGDLIEHLAGVGTVAELVDGAFPKT